MAGTWLGHRRSCRSRDLKLASRRMFNSISSGVDPEMTGARKFSRQQMLDLIWSAPMRNVAADLGVSDVGLKKAVIKAGLPTPPQGHWNRVFAGRSVAPKPSLPPRGFGASDDIWIGGNSWSRYMEAKIDDPPPSDPSSTRRWKAFVGGRKKRWAASPRSEISLRRILQSGRFSTTTPSVPIR